MKAVIASQAARVAASRSSEKVFSVSHGEMTPTPAGASLLKEIGGLSAVIKFTSRFYHKMFNDQYLRQFLNTKTVEASSSSVAAAAAAAATGCPFVASSSSSSLAAPSPSAGKEKLLQTPIDVHAARLAKYICEMISGDQVWTHDMYGKGPLRDEKISTARGDVLIGGRADAHYCAWNSTERPENLIGRRFKLPDTRVWMRLFFWAAREEGFVPTQAAARGECPPTFIPDASSTASPQQRFFGALLCFVAHFIAVYERTARVFAFNEAMWSARAENTEQYISRGCSMDENVFVQSYGNALEAVPEAWLVHDRDLYA